MGELVPFERAGRPGEQRWGKAGQRLTEQQAADRKARRQRELAKHEANARTTLAAARKAWEQGRILPWRITSALDMRGLDGPEVDEACGTVEPAVDLWEEGKLYPTWEELLALSKLTGFGPIYFVRDGVTKEPLDARDTSLWWHLPAAARREPIKPPVLAFTHQALVNAGIYDGEPDVSGGLQDPLF